MKGKSFVLTIVTALVMWTIAVPAVFSGGGSEKSAVAKTLKIAYLPPNFEQADFYGQYFLGLSTGLDKLGIGYQLVQRTPETHDNHAQQLSIVEDVITMGVDYIVMAPTHYEGQQQAYRAINKAGIPLFIFNYSAPFPAEFGAKAMSYIGYKHSDGGKATADYIKENYPKGSKIAIIYGTPTQISYDRGAKDLHIANGMQIVYEHYANWQRDQAYDATQRLLTAFPDVNIIVGCSSFMTMGAVRAASDAGRIQNLAIFGAGAILEELEAITDKKLQGAWYRDPVRMGEETAKYIHMHMNGREKEIPESYNVPIIMIDSVDAIRKNINPITYKAANKPMP